MSKYVSYMAFYLSLSLSPPLSLSVCVCVCVCVCWFFEFVYMLSRFQSDLVVCVFILDAVLSEAALRIYIWQTGCKELACYYVIHVILTK